MAEASTKVGGLVCQQQPFLQRHSTTVLACTQAAAAPVSSTKKADAAAAQQAAAAPPSFEVVLQDSVLFPEGGGQPWDLGTVNGQEVTSVTRRGDTCIIHVRDPIAVGAEVEVVVDWKRRLDHMQHHTAQHLVTAIVERELGLPTESWSLTHPYCFIQVPTAKIDEADVARCEAIINDLITSGKSVQVMKFASRDDLPPARSRKIPADVTGPIRIIDIQDVDSCTCCGTHMTNLSQLQVVKLLHQEAKGATCKLFFAVGQRVVANFGDMYNRERALVKEIGTAAPQLLATVQRRAQDAAEDAKQVKKLLAEVAQLVAPAVAKEAAASPDDSTPFFFLREDAEMDFLSTIATALTQGAPHRTCVLGCGSLKEADAGAVMMVGPRVAEVSAVFLPLVNGKGGQSKLGFRGKCDMRKWKAAVKGFSTAAAPAVAPAATASA